MYKYNITLVLGTFDNPFPSFLFAIFEELRRSVCGGECVLIQLGFDIQVLKPRLALALRLSHTCEAPLAGKY